MLQVSRAFGAALLAVTLAAGAPAAAQGGGSGTGAAAAAGNGAGAGGQRAGDVGVPTGGLGNPGAPEGSKGVSGSSRVASPNAVPTLNGQGIDTSLSENQSARDRDVATETQQRIGDRVDNQFNWGLLGLLGLLGLFGLMGRRRD